MASTSKQAKQNHSLPGVVFGEVIYWTTLGAALLVLLGLVLTFSVASQGTQASTMLTSIWQGQHVDEIWHNAQAAQPDGHWYLTQLNTGHGLMAAGISLGVFSVIPAMLAAGGLIGWREKRVVFGGLALLAAGITLTAVLG